MSKTEFPNLFHHLPVDGPLSDLVRLMSIIRPTGTGLCHVTGGSLSVVSSNHEPDVEMVVLEERYRGPDGETVRKRHEFLIDRRTPPEGLVVG